MSETNARSDDRVRDLDRLRTSLRLAPGSRLLDAGCGTGQFSIAFAEIGCQVTGIDIAPAMIERARAHGRERAVDIEWRVGTLDRIEDPDGRYDAVHARNVLQFVEDVPQTLTEFRRVLKPGGRLFASVPGALSPIYRNSWQRFVNPGGANANFMVPWELSALLTDQDWTIVEGWGEYGHASPELPSSITATMAAGLPLPLQQAAATIWSFIAE